MNDVQKEQREDALLRYYGKCPVCGKSIYEYSTPQYDHRIADTKANRAKYGDFVIDHRLNIGMACSLACNGKLDISGDTGIEAAHVLAADLGIILQE